MRDKDVILATDFGTLKGVAHKFVIRNRLVNYFKT